MLELQGFDESSVVQQAENRGYAVLAVRPRASLSLPWPGAQARFPVGAFSQDLLVLLDAGLPLLEVMQTLAEREHRGEFRALLSSLCTIVREGNPLSAALKRFPQAFPALYVATVQASETTGHRVPAVERCVAYQNQVDAVRKRLIAASIYPTLLIAVGALVSLFLLFYVVPRFSSIFEERGVDLPFFSRLMLAWGQLVHGHGALAFAALAGGALAAVHALRQPAIRSRIEDALRRLPSVGERLKLYQLARFYRTIGMLLRGGVPLVSALQMGSELLHPALRARLAAASRAIREGRPVAASMEANRLTTPRARPLPPRAGGWWMSWKRCSPSTPIRSSSASGPRRALSLFAWRNCAPRRLHSTCCRLPNARSMPACCCAAAEICCSPQTIHFPASCRPGRKSASRRHFRGGWRTGAT